MKFLILVQIQPIYWNVFNLQTDNYVSLLIPESVAPIKKCSIVFYHIIVVLFQG